LPAAPAGKPALPLTAACPAEPVVGLTAAGAPATRELPLIPALALACPALSARLDPGGALGSEDEQLIQDHEITNNAAATCGWLGRTRVMSVA
jgi:hypothetical protein